ncbi:MAG TPA: zf-HC2 domain-containing protein [Ktedonobacterales bacterium]|nr:zf-HC2 domain-containing protein [Ktedonobacterales bacterium]
MNCKWAEGYLSACLDGTLDPDVRDEVVAHIETCTRCSALLDEYRHFDGLVAGLPRYEPPAELRSHIFDSPDFAAIVRSLEAGADEVPAARHPTPLRPFLLSRPHRRGTHDRALTPLPIAPAAGELSPSDTANPVAGPAATPPVAAHTGSGGPPPLVRAALVAAALLIAALGTTLLLQRGLSHGTVKTPGSISNVGGFQGAPLTAGPRAIYERAGALWSLPEHGNGVAQRLTPANVEVGAGWAVVPVRAGAGGDLVAYVDLKTGALHIVRSDDQKDQVAGQALVPVADRAAIFWSGPEGQALLGGLTWSPDGTQLAYLADPQGTGQTSLMVVHADGTDMAMIPAAAGSSSAQAAWSPDSQALVFAQTTGAGQSLWLYNPASRQLRNLGSATDAAGAANAAVLALGWANTQAGLTVTWASGDAASGTVSGVFSAAAQPTGAARRLTPAGRSFATAAYSASAAGGTWLLGDGAGVSTLAVQGASLAPLASIASGVQAVAWSPDGSVASFLSTTGTLSVWINAATIVPVATGVAAQPAMAWTADGSALAFVAAGQLNIVRLNAGTVGVPVAVAGLSNPTALVWAPDGQQLAVTTTAGVALVGVAGTSMRLLDRAPAAGNVSWSVAR